ncbi:MAG: hypothetical protein ACRCSN_14525 [Dermatophilaceae bacterium]
MAESRTRDSRCYTPRQLSAWVIVAGTARQVWPLLASAVCLVALSLGWWVSSDDAMLVRLAAAFLEVVAIGLVGSFALHEWAHVVVLRRVSTVTSIVVERTFWRFSVVPRGSMTARQVVAVAAAGPLVCVVTGLVGLLVDPDALLGWWFVAHGIFLLPPFGDGRSLCSGLRGRGVGEHVAVYPLGRRCR